MTDITWTEIAPDIKYPADIFMSSTESDAISSWTKIEERLLALRRLEDDWDGLGACAPAPELVDSAFIFLKKYKADGAPSPKRVVAGPNGEIVFEWQLQGVVLQAEIEEPGRVIWTEKASGERAVCWEIDFESKNQDELWGTSETLAPGSIAV